MTYALQYNNNSTAADLWLYPFLPIHPLFVILYSDSVITHVLSAAMSHHFPAFIPISSSSLTPIKWCVQFPEIGFFSPTLSPIYFLSLSHTLTSTNICLLHFPSFDLLVNTEFLVTFRFSSEEFSLVFTLIQTNVYSPSMFLFPIFFVILPRSL